MKAGDTYRFTRLPGKKTDIHLWVIISDPSLDDQKVLSINLTTHRPWKDGSCIIYPGEHPFVRHDTCIWYIEPRTTPLADLVSQLRAGLIAADEPVSGPLLERIRKGGCHSLSMPNGAKRILMAQRFC